MEEETGDAPGDNDVSVEEATGDEPNDAVMGMNTLNITTPKSRKDTKVRESFITRNSIFNSTNLGETCQITPTNIAASHSRDTLKNAGRN